MSAKMATITTIGKWCGPWSVAVDDHEPFIVKDHATADRLASLLIGSPDVVSVACEPVED